MSTYQSEDPCVACGTVAVQRCYHHLSSRGALGAAADRPHNMISLCLVHHNMIHKSVVLMFQRFPTVRQWLEDHARWDILEKVDK